MKKVLINLLKIVIFLTGVIYLFVHISYANRDAFSHTRKNIAGFYYEEDDTIDVAIVGTSCTFSAFMPMKLWEDYGISAYDVCTNLMFEDAMPFVIREILETQKPEIIVIDLSPYLLGNNKEQFENIGLNPRGNIDGFKYSLNRMDMINSIISDPKDRWEYYFDILYYHKNGKFSPEFWNYSKQNSNKGYNNLVYVLQDSNSGTFENEIGQFEFPENELIKLNLLLEEIKNRDYECLFTILPYHESLTIEYVNNRALFLESYISEKGFTVLNMYEKKEEIGLGAVTDYSCDETHFHALSAEKITTYFGRYLMDNYSLEDHRGDEKYSSWRECEVEWNENLLGYREAISDLMNGNEISN